MEIGCHRQVTGIEVSCLSGNGARFPCRLRPRKDQTELPSDYRHPYHELHPRHSGYRDWNWLVIPGNTIEQLWSTSEPISWVINVTQTASVPANGKVWPSLNDDR